MKNLLLAAAIGLSAMACTDRATENPDPGSNPQLPAITQTGANTFGCKLNGVVFVPNKGSGSTVTEHPLTVSGFYDNTDNWSSRVNGWRGTDVKNMLYIQVYLYKSVVIGKGDYPIGQAPIYDDNPPFYSYIKCRAVSPSTGKYKNYGTYDNTGSIKITHMSTDKFIFSGTFSGKLKDLEGTETVEVTDGRFDINLKTL